MNLVGFMRNGKRPSGLAKLTAMLCESQGINLLYMRPEDINIEENSVTGLIFEDNKWKKLEAAVPSVIDLNQACFKKKNRTIIHYLRKNSLLTYDTKNPLNKQELMSKLEEDNNFSYLAIPSSKTDNFENMINFLGEHESIVMKPIHSDRGRGVYILRKKQEDYILGYLTKEKILNHEELKSFFDETIKGKRYILQKYISSRTKNGDPFDCRVHVQKNGQGKWVVVRNYIRIGIGQKVISNVNQGGGISDIIPFLKANFDGEWERINKKINHLAKTLPYKIEELKGAQSMAIGFDVAINKDGEIYLFESNGAPAVKPVVARTSLLRVEYYQYLINNALDKSKITKVEPLNNNAANKTKNNEKNYLTQIKKLKKKITEIQIENNALIEEIKSLKNSNSWKLTKPLRKVREKLNK